MADQLYFSRDTRLFVQMRNQDAEDDGTAGAGTFWEIPILDGYSFSQTTNTSEILLSEMESTAGISRRGRRMFTDSLAPAEWSFSTYIRPFKSKGSGAIAGDGILSADQVLMFIRWKKFFGLQWQVLMFITVLLVLLRLIL